MENKLKYIIFGASGDLSKRYLIPALTTMESVEMVPISRKDYSNIKNIIPSEGEKIFHLAIPPEGVEEAVKLISENFGKGNKNNLKIMLEKPFGKDLESAKNLIEHIDQYFSEDQIYRVDHYLAKDSLRKVVEEKWDMDSVASLQIIASEKIDIEGRANFYEQTGALKDFVQSHLLEMVAIVLSQSFDTARRHDVLKNLEIVCDISHHECVKRGQYQGYREEVGNPSSMTETFVSINIASNDPALRGVRITLATGKALKEKLTQVKIKFKDGGEKIFNIEHEPEAYERVIEAAISGNHDLFISSGEIVDSWRILEDIESTWKNSTTDLIIYPKGIAISDLN